MIFKSNDPSTDYTCLCSNNVIDMCTHWHTINFVTVFINRYLIIILIIKLSNELCCIDQRWYWLLVKFPMDYTSSKLLCKPSSVCEKELSTKNLHTYYIGAFNSYYLLTMTFIQSAQSSVLQFVKQWLNLPRNCTTGTMMF